ncbi:type III secretion system domain-containing protein [Edwardsiella piscicida]|uniref:type III secretion system domain-containing protein n=1 Tax=Edwardsiella piscicida TaxID=1263550 RepID=UPI000934F09F|nr:type III secretion system domain-containing protein [Edwardsiella piscicida]
MTPARQHLYQIWHQPGHIIDPAWWGALGLHCWQSIYRDSPLARPALDTLLRQRLGQNGLPPALTPLSSDLLSSAERRATLLLAMGLWALEAGGLLLLKPYRETLSDALDPLSIGQLQVLLPYGAAPESLPPASLCQRARELGIAWLSQAPDPALRACRLYAPPSQGAAPEGSPIPILQKLARWL